MQGIWKVLQDRTWLNLAYKRHMMKEIMKYGSE